MKLNCAVCYAELDSFEGKVAVFDQVRVTTRAGEWRVGRAEEEANHGLWARCPDHPPAPATDEADKAFAVILERIREVVKTDRAEAERIVKLVETRLNAALATAAL